MIKQLKGLMGEELNGFLDQGSELLGELRFQDTFRVDGRVRGRIVSDNTLIVGETGRVEADIECGVVSIRGFVIGHVHGRQRIELLSGARVQGTLVAPKLVIEDGATFQGDCDMSPTAGTAQHPGGSEANPIKNHTKEGP
jgi:cytoskeletal protein CcmA (bactofilin family)